MAAKDAGNEMTTVGPVPSLGPSSTSTVSTATEPIVSDVAGPIVIVAVVAVAIFLIVVCNKARRRLQRQSGNPSAISTISGTMGANVNAYRHYAPSTRVTTANETDVPSPLSSSQPLPYGDLPPSYEDAIKQSAAYAANTSHLNTAYSASNQNLSNLPVQQEVPSTAVQSAALPSSSLPSSISATVLPSTGINNSAFTPESPAYKGKKISDPCDSSVEATPGGKLQDENDVLNTSAVGSTVAPPSDRDTTPSIPQSPGAPSHAPQTSGAPSRAPQTPVHIHCPMEEVGDGLRGSASPDIVEL